MKKLLYIASALVLAACANELEDIAPERAAKSEAEVPEAPLREIVIQVDEDCFNLVNADIEAGQVKTKSASLNALADELDIVSMERLYPDAGEYEQSCRKYGLHRYYIVRYREPVDGTKATEIALRGEGIANAEIVRKVTLRGFNDPYLKYQWHYVNTVKAGNDINVKEVWEKYTTGSPEVIVCVVDEGVAYTHPDIADNMWTDGNGKHGYNFSRNDGEIKWNGSGDIGHGTHVAGTIAAINNNGKGVCGIAGGDYAAGKGGVKIMSCQIFDSVTGSCVSDYLCGQAIRYGGLNGAVISQNSWGTGMDDFNNDGEIDSQDLAIFKQIGISSYIDNAINWFVEYAGCDGNGNQLPTSPMKGGLVCFAAGNDDVDYDPVSANNDLVVSVGAFGPSGNKASYSQYGDWVDLGAPGGDGEYFYIDGNLQPFIYSLGTNNDYVYWEWAGTSMACPHASGVAALAVSYFGGQGFTSAQLREAMIQGSDVVAFTNSSKPIGRKLNALGIFNYLLDQQIPPEPPAAPSSFTVSASGNTLTYSLSVGEDYKGNPVKSYILLASKNRSALAAADPSNPGAGIVSASVAVSGAIGSMVSGKITGLDFSAQYYAAVAAVDSDGRVSVLSAIKSISTGVNNPPVISTSYTGDFRFLPTESVVIPFTVSDPDSHDFTVAFTTDGKAGLTGSGSSWTFRLNAKQETFGVERSASIKATDSYGLSTVYDISYTVLVPEPPAAPDFTVGADMNVLNISWTLGTDCFGNKIKSYKILCSKSREDLVGINPASPASSVKTAVVNVGSSASVGSSLGGSISSLEFDTPYYVTLCAYDANALWSTDNKIIQTRTQVNHAPVIETSYSGEFVFLHDQYVTIPFTISDPDGHACTVSFSTTGKATMTGSGSSRTVVINGSKETGKGTLRTFTVVATDSYGMVSAKSFDYTVLPNRAPLLSAEIPGHIINGLSYRISVDLSEYFTDPDGDVLSYEIVADDNIVTLSRSGSVLSITSAGYGMAEITIIATDTENADVKATLKVLVRSDSGSVGEVAADDVIIDIYPNPVSRFLYVRGGVTPVETSIRVKTSTGTVVYDNTVPVSGFAPCAIDMKNSAPGKYIVTVGAGGETVTRTVVKR
ncbi:MAG: S8 family serine peptidase [Bacteroidales bacterium]|nr:S8 family serine peptidase [Bacteroidales bacterium]